MSPIEVEAYAGISYPERPLRVRWQGRWRRIIAVEHKHQEPHRRCFTVVLESLPAQGQGPAAPPGDIRLRLCYHYANDVWQAQALTAHPEDQ